MTLMYSMVLEVVKIHVHAKFHQAKCSGSSVIVLTKFWRCCKQYRRWFHKQ